MALAVHDVEQALDTIRRALNMDGGDLELVSIGEDGVVTIRFQGACCGCPHAKITLKSYIERVMKEQIPDLKEVVMA